MIFAFSVYQPMFDQELGRHSWDMNYRIILLLKGGGIQRDEQDNHFSVERSRKSIILRPGGHTQRISEGTSTA